MHIAIFSYNLTPVSEKIPNLIQVYFFYTFCIKTSTKILHVRNLVCEKYIVIGSLHLVWPAQTFFNMICMQL